MDFRIFILVRQRGEHTASRTIRRGAVGSGAAWYAASRSGGQGPCPAPRPGPARA